MKTEPVQQGQKGWRMVPLEPTPEMMAAGLYQSSADTRWEDLYSAWKDMLTVAPPPEPAEPAQAAATGMRVSIPTETMEQEFQAHYRRGFEAGRKAAPTGQQAEPLRDALEAIRDWPTVEPQDWSFTVATMVAVARKALAGQQAEPAKCARCGGTGVVDDGALHFSEGGIPYENGPIKCVKDCPVCKATGQQAESTMVAIAKRNLRAYLSKASFASNVDRQAALDCVQVLEEALAGQQAERRPAATFLRLHGYEREADWLASAAVDAALQAPAEPKALREALEAMLESYDRDQYRSWEKGSPDWNGSVKKARAALAAAPQAPPGQQASCPLGCTTECKARMHGSASECPALPNQPPFGQQAEPIREQAAHDEWWNSKNMSAEFGMMTMNQSRAAWQERARRAGQQAERPAPAGQAVMVGESPVKWRIATNRHPNTDGTRWGWIEGAPGNVCWSDERGSNLTRAQAGQMVLDHNNEVGATDQSGEGS